MCERARESETSSTITSIKRRTVVVSLATADRVGVPTAWAGEPWGVGAGDG